MKKLLLDKSRIYPLVLVLAMFVVYQYRKSNPPTDYISLKGTTMGVVPYLIKYKDSERRSFQKETDSLLKAFNQSLSTYIPDSEISDFNKNGKLVYRSPFFYPVIKRSKEIYETSEGAFNPCVMPLVRAWKFGPDKELAPETVNVDSLLSFVDFEGISFDEKQISRDTLGVELDFSAIAKGYGVDVVGAFLEKNGIVDYMVEIGGELLCKGKNARGEAWVIGIDNPRFDEEGEVRSKGIVQLKDMAVATSGNYRNFYEKDGKRYSHTIDPKTGYPVEHSLLSASVFAPDCMTADAYATAFMVLGVEKAKEIIRKAGQKHAIEAYLIYDENGKMKTFTTDGIKGAFLDDAGL